MKHTITVGWKHTIIDSAEIEVEAPTLAEAQAMALKAAEVGKIGLEDIEWDDGEVVDGEYILLNEDGSVPE